MLLPKAVTVLMVKARAILELGALFLGLREKAANDYSKQIAENSVRELTSFFPWLYRAASQYPEIFGPEFELAGRDPERGALTFTFHSRREAWNT